MCNQMFVSDIPDKQCDIAGWALHQSTVKEAELLNRDHPNYMKI